VSDPSPQFKIGDKVRCVVNGVCGIVVKDLRRNPWTQYDWAVSCRGRLNGSIRQEIHYFGVELERIDALPSLEEQ